jgi:hypothetical protein
VAGANGETRRSGHFATLEEGEIAAVDHAGNVHRLNVEKIDVQALLELGEERAMSVIEARAQFETERMALAAGREEMMERRMQRATEISADGEAGPSMEDRGVRSAGGIAGGLVDSGVRSLASLLEFGSDFISPPKPPTKEQAKQRREATKQARGRRAARQETAARIDETIEMSRAGRARAEREEEERARERQRQREQELGRDR